MGHIETGYPAYVALIRSTEMFCKSTLFDKTRKSGETPRFRLRDAGLDIKLGFLNEFQYQRRGGNDLDKRPAWVTLNLNSSLHLHSEGLLVPNVEEDSDVSGFEKIKTAQSVASEYVLHLKQFMGNVAMDIECVRFLPYRYQRNGKGSLTYLVDCPVESLNKLVGDEFRSRRLTHTTSWGDPVFGNKKFGVDVSILPFEDSGRSHVVRVQFPGYADVKRDGILLPHHPRDWYPIRATADALKSVRDALQREGGEFKCTAANALSMDDLLGRAFGRNTVYYKISLAD
jgi:hypothetical protein